MLAFDEKGFPLPMAQRPLEFAYVSKVNIAHEVANKEAVAYRSGHEYLSAELAAVFGDQRQANIVEGAQSIAKQPGLPVCGGRFFLKNVLLSDCTVPLRFCRFPEHQRSDTAGLRDQQRARGNLGVIESHWRLSQAYGPGRGRRSPRHTRLLG
jgi:hypothetical protein